MKAKWFAAAVAVYLLVLKFIFPGYIRPLTPHHNDFYIPPGLAYDEFSFWQHLRFPRPAGFFLMQVTGLLGLSGWMLAFIAIALLNVFLVVRLVERLTGRDAHPAWALLYMLLVLAHPSFYFDYIHDGVATASLCYILLAMHAWLSFRDTGRRRYLAVCGALFLLAWLTKETYFLSALVLWGVELVRSRDRRPAWQTLGALAATFVAGLLLNVFSINPFIVTNVAPTSPYYMSLAPASVLGAWCKLLRILFTPVTLLIVFAALATLWRNRIALLYAATLFVAGLVALLPNSVLPNHLDPMYAWAGACLAFAPILFVGWRPTLRAPVPFVAAFAVAVACGYGAVRANKPAYEKWQWTLNQERANHNILRSFAALQRAQGSRILIAGVGVPYHPWTIPSFIRAEFGPDRQWTFILPRGRSFVSKSPVTYVDASQVDISRFDAAFGYAEDGHLLRQWNAGDLKQLAAAGDADRVLQPALIEPLDALAKDPNNWFFLMQVGNVYADWGKLDQAARYLARACEDDTVRNPYPPYFYGIVQEALGRSDLAVPLFEQAIALDSKPGNPAFTAGLNRARAKVATPAR